MTLRARPNHRGFPGPRSISWPVLMPASLAVFAKIRLRPSTIRVRNGSSQASKRMHVQIPAHSFRPAPPSEAGWPELALIPPWATAICPPCPPRWSSQHSNHAQPPVERSTPSLPPMWRRGFKGIYFAPHLTLRSTRTRHSAWPFYGTGTHQHTVSAGRAAGAGPVSLALEP